MAESNKIQNYYKFEKILGEGSFGQVKKAIKKSTGEQFAVKIIKKGNLSTEDLMSLELEVEILQKVKEQDTKLILIQIDHPNIVKLFEIYDDEDNFYMVLELMTGGELFERIVEKDHYTEKEAAETIKPLVDALRYCHQMGIAHRDLKPENLLYQNTGESSVIKISDFGLARFINDDVMTTQCGTPGYVAPEIIKGTGYNEMIDWWSIGIVLYILLCGFPPFYDENNDTLFKMITEGQFDFPSPYWDEVSDLAKDLIKKLLCVDPKNRWNGDKIVAHPWLENKVVTKLMDVPKNIRDMAKKKFKKNVNAVRGVIKLTMMQRAFGKKS